MPHNCCRAEFPEARVDVELLDLSDLDSVRAFGKKAQKDSQHLDVLLNNAGAAIAFCCGRFAQQFDHHRSWGQRSGCVCTSALGDS